MGKRVVVIGAGIAGLASAALLLREGWDVVVVEKQHSVGGRAGELEVDGFRFDTGPSWYLMPEAFDEFFRACGTSTERELDLVDLSPAYRIYNDDGAFFDIHSGVDNVVRLFESIEPGAGERVRAYLARSSDIYAVALSSFLYTTFSHPTQLVTRDVLTRLGTLALLLTRSLDRLVSAQFQDYRLRQVLTYPAVFLSTEPTAAPALYSLMSHTDLVEGVRYPQGGFAAVVAAIARQAQGATFLMDTAVTAIECTEGRATGVRLDDGHVISAETVVSAADLRHTETSLLPQSAQTYPESYFARRDPGLGTVLVFLGVRGALPELAHHTLLFSKDWAPDFRAVYHAPENSRPLGASESIYVSKTSATDTAVAPEGCENLFVLVPVPAEENFGAGNAYGEEESPRVGAIADAAIHQIGTWLGIPDFAERIVVRRTVGPSDFARRYNSWAGGAVGPAHTLRQSAFFRGRNASRKLKNLYYAGGTTVPGVGVPMCLISAHNVITRMREKH